MGTLIGLMLHEPARLMREIESLERAIHALCDNDGQPFEAERLRLVEELDLRMRVLDVRTRPPVSRVICPGRKEVSGFEYAGVFHEHRTAIALYRALLRKLWEDLPDDRRAMARAMSARGTMRTYVARDREDLFPLGYSRGWIRRFSEPLIDGWYFDTNLNNSRKQLLCGVAIRAAGLQPGRDIRIVWP